MGLFTKYLKALINPPRVDASPAVLEALEQRSLLSTAFPALSALESPNNPVVRFETNLGTIDIELFQTQAPITVANFLSYVTSGRLDETFFHRAVDSGISVVQGGGFTYRTDRTPRVQNVATDAPIVLEQTGRNNLARTLSMARTSSPNSATSQFFINVQNNPSLDASNNRYAVFGRVVQGWEVVQAMDAKPITNLSSNPGFTGQFSGAMGEVPTNSAIANPNTQNITTNDLLTLINAEIIKPADLAAFYAHQLVFPEGFRSASSVETLELFNPNTNTASYQIIARYAFGIRDVVVAQGTLAANTHRTIRLSSWGDAALTAIRNTTAYSIFVESACATSDSVPVNAVWRRDDLGARSEVDLWNASRFEDADKKNWLIPRIERRDYSVEFIGLQNLTEKTANVTITFTRGNQVVATVNRTIEPFRHDGIRVSQFVNLPGTNLLSAKIVSSEPIAAELSDWDLPVPGNTGAATPGWMVMAIPGGGLTTGMLPSVLSQTGWQSNVSLFNPGTTLGVVVLRFYRSNLAAGTAPIETTVVLLPGERKDFEITQTTTGVPTGERFALQYQANVGVPVGVSYNSVDLTNRNLANGGRQTAGNSANAQTFVGNATHFAYGFNEPSRFGVNTNQVQEIVSVWNPFASTQYTMRVYLQFRFTDGTTIASPTYTVNNLRRLDIIPNNIQAVRNKINSNPAQFRKYGISVIYQTTAGGQPLQVGGVAMLQRIDRASYAEAFFSMGIVTGDYYKLDNPGFQ